MLTVRTGPAVGVTAQVALLTALELTLGLSAWAWAVGLTCGVVVNAAVAVSLARNGADALGAGDVVTLVRATLACGVAALTAESFSQQSVATTLVAVGAIALVLDAVDGWVARHTRTASIFGARFDGEVDALLILILSVYVAGTVGGWVFAIGAMRYAFAMAGWVVPWLRGQLPFRYWRKVVTATQGIVLIVAAAGVLPRSWTNAALVIALALLAESFGRDVWWLWQHRQADAPAPGGAGAPRAWQGGRRRGRAVAAAATNTAALLLVWFALLTPNQADRMTPSTFLRIPIEGLALAGLALILSSRARRALAALAGVLLGLLTVVKIVDMGFFAALDRPFNLVTDRGYFGSAVDLVRDSIGPVGAALAVIAAAVLAVGVLVCTPLAVGRLLGLAARHRRWSTRVLIVLAATWVVCATFSLRVAPGEPIATASASHVAADQVRALVAGARDVQRFDAAAAVDRFRDSRDRDLLAGLRGKDVLVAFVESYGRVAIEGSRSSPRVQAILDVGTERLRASGYSSRSAFLTSPTFGGLSWLAHSTLQSGLWVDNEPRHDRLLSGDRMTITQAFSTEGWRTVAVMPTNDEEWPEGEAFYRFDKIYGRWDLGYSGPRFGFSTMPDQFVLSAFQRLELEKRDRAPVMAQIDLTSSHTPWAPLPRMVDWNSLGDGTVFDRIHAGPGSAKELWRHPEHIEAAYADSIAYCLSALISFVETYGDDNLVLILLGDHQPAPVVSGHAVSHDVPITVIAHDPRTIDRISAWGWQEGMRPGPQAPVWPMDAFRDRFLAAYSPHLPPVPLLHPSAPQR